MRRFIDIVNQNLLLEAKAYEQMLDAIETILTQVEPLLATNNIRSTIKDVKAFAKTLRQDRAVWFVREIRIKITEDIRVYLSNVSAVNKNVLKGRADEKDVLAMLEICAQALEKSELLLKRYRDDYFKTTGEEPPIPRSSGTIQYLFIANMIEHFLGIPYSKIQNFVFLPQLGHAALFDQLQKLEQEFIDRARGNVKLQEGDKIILSLPDNYAWIKLNRAACDQEGASMGHCGNSPRRGSDERIISLRQRADVIDGIEYWKPCLTFILHPDGYLGEMKGRGNLKPAEHYHDAISALLKLPMIAGLRGGGYLAANNFALSDIRGEKGDALVKEKPSLATPQERLDRFGLTPDLIADIYKQFLTQGHGWLLKTIKDFPRSARDKLTALHLDMLPPDEYYKECGMDDRMMLTIRNGVMKAGSSWYRNSHYYTHGLSLSGISKEARKKLFTTYPEIMPPEYQYEVEGMSDNFMKVIHDGVEEYGLKWYQENKVYPISFSDDDKEKLFTRYPSTSTFTWRWQEHGSDKDFQKSVILMLADYEYSQNGDYSVEVEMEDDKPFFVFWTWDNVEKLINAHGDSSDDDHFDHIGVDSSDHYVDNFEDIIGLQAAIKIAQHAESLLTQDDEDRLEDFDPAQWSEVLEVLKEFDEDEVDKMTDAVRSGYESAKQKGYESAKQKALQNIDLSYGEMRYTMYKTQDGKSYINLHEPVKFGMTPYDVAKFIDTDFNDSCEGDLKDFLNDGDQRGGSIKLHVPHYGFQGFDEEEAASHYIDDTELLDDLEKNPYSDEIVAKMSSKELLTAIKDVYEKIPVGMIFRPDFDQMKNIGIEKLKEKLNYIVKKFYG